jgi:hypothetical protein
MWAQKHGCYRDYLLFMKCKNMSSDSMHMYSKIENILGKIGLSTVFETFKREKIDENVAVSLSDNELIRLGISTIGDRTRFRDLCQREVNQLNNASSDGATATTFSSTAVHSSRSQRSQAQRERALLFNIRANTNRTQSQPSTTTSKRVSRKRTWTSTFLCLADRLATRVPSVEEKQILQNAGLGLKNIKFSADDDEKTVAEKICSSDVNIDTGKHTVLYCQ